MSELVNDINNGSNVIIFSPRRNGKTSLINQVLEIARQKGVLTFYIDLIRQLTSTGSSTYMREQSPPDFPERLPG